MPDPRKASALGIDRGTRRTGFAVADPLRIVLQPLEPCEHGADEAALWAHVEKLLSERDVSHFVLGLPLDMDGSEGPKAREVRAFAERLHARFPRVAIAWCDERLSSKEAEELLRADGRGGPKGRRLRDSYSALVILRDWIAAAEPS